MKLLIQSWTRAVEVHDHILVHPIISLSGTRGYDHGYEQSAQMVSSLSLSLDETATLCHICGYVRTSS